MRIADQPSAIPHEALNRDCPSWASPAALLAQRLEFIGKGGVIQQLPAGASAEVHKTMPNSAQRKGGQRGAAAKNGTKYKQTTIRMEEGL